MDERVVENIPEELNVLPVSDIVIYPTNMVPLMITEKSLIEAVNDAMGKERVLCALTLKEKTEEISPDKLFTVGTAVSIQKLFRMPDGSLRILVFGLSKVKVLEFTQREPFLRARVLVIPETYEETKDIKAYVRRVQLLSQEILEFIPYIPEEIKRAPLNVENPIQLVYLVAPMVKMDLKERQEILEEDSVLEKLKKLVVIMERELEILKLTGKIQKEVSSEISKAQREHFLREQLKAIQKELGELDEVQAEINEIREKMEKKALPDYVRKEIEKELKRMEKIPPASAEFGVIRTYIDWLLDLPWMEETEDNLDINRAEKILDEDHYDLRDVKERIIEFLSVRKLKKDMKGPILCFVGPPGVGKTSLGKSIARALGRKFIRISLGGVSDEAEIRGHRRTYVGAMPGKIIDAMRKVGTKNPVFMLDEVDKIARGVHGDPAAALLEVLDPEQNSSFVDHYINLPFDLSKVFFIATANVLDTIIPPLRDRFEVIHIPGYTLEDKIHIAKKYLIPKQLKENGLEGDGIVFTDGALRLIIESYTREAGVRNLERRIGQVLRKIAVKKAKGKRFGKRITERTVERLLGPEEMLPEELRKVWKPGVATGLAWTEAGGEIIYVEAAVMPGKKGFILTGSLGDVMQESAKAALTYVRSLGDKLGVDRDYFEKTDIHLHVPAGAVPKDGPSAGITMATALFSAIKGVPVRRDVAMTGEITVTGLVLPVGGIKEKVLAARRAGIKHVILPKKNKKDLAKLEPYMKKGIRFYFVELMEEVLKKSFKRGVV